MMANDGNTRSKKKDTSSASLSGSVDGSGLRRSSRETPSKKQATASPSNARRSEGIENQTAPTSTPIKKKHDKTEEQMGQSPLRRSDRSKKQVSTNSSGSKKVIEVPASSNTKSKMEKVANSSKEDSVDVSVDTKSERKDSDIGARKRKIMTVRGYVSLFKPQKVRIGADGQGSNVHHTPPESGRSTESGNGEREIDGKSAPDNNGEILAQDMDVDAPVADNDDQIAPKSPLSGCNEHGGDDDDNQVAPKSPSSGCKKHGGNDDDQIAPESPLSGLKKHGGDDDDYQTAPESPLSNSKNHADDEACHESSKEERINNDSKNQQQPDFHDKTHDKDLQETSTTKGQQESDSHGKTHDKDIQETSTSKVRKTSQEAPAMETTENNSKFVEYWVPVQLSNVQLEQYCSTLLSNAMALRSYSKSDSFGAFHDILISNQKCCNHPYVLDKELQPQIVKDESAAIHWDLGFKASGKVHFLDLILPEVKKRKLRAVILFQPFQPTVSAGKDTYTKLGNILDDFVFKRFNEDSYERVDGAQIVLKEKLKAVDSFNTNKNKFLFLIDRPACHPSIKLSSVDIVIIFDSDPNPANDIKSLQKISIDSNSDQIMILRLYSKNTLEEKILKLAEQNVYVDSKLQTLSRITCHALLMWGAKDLFKKLEIFHGKSGKEISSEERFLKDVMEEFLCVISGKGLKDGGKSLITKLQSCGYYGNKNIPGQLADGEQPHEFWRDLLEGKSPTWKYVSVSTSRQRKRPQYREDSLDINAPIGEVVKRRKRSPTIKPVIEKEIGWVNDGAFSESRSPSGGPYWSAAVTNAKSLPDLLKPTVFELCNLLKLPVDVKNIVDNFLDFVLDNYTVSKDHTSTLQAFMLSLCWIGALLTNCKIDKKVSFALAKKHLNFHCKEEEANAVYLKLEGAKEIFLKQTESQEKDDESEPPGQPARTESTKSQHDQNVENSETREYNEENPEVNEKEKEIEKFKREWDEKRANLENEYKVEKALIRTVHKNPSTRSEKLKGLEKVFEGKFEEHEREKEIRLKELKATLLAAEGQVADDNGLPENDDSSDMSISVEKIDGEGVKTTDMADSNELPENHADTSISVENPDGGGDKMTDMPLEVDGGPSKEKGSLGGGDDNESTGSHTSETEMVVTEEVPPRQHDAVDDDVEVVLVEEVSEKEDGEIEDNVEENVEKVESGIPEVDSSEQNPKEGTSNADVAHVVSGETGVPGGDADKEISEDSHAVDEQNDSCSSSSNQTSAGVPQDNTPSVQLPASQPPDHPVETQNESLQEQSSEPQTQDKEGQVDPITLPEMDVDHPPVVDTQINPMAENQSDTNPQNDENAPEPGRNVEQHQPNVPASNSVNNQQAIEQPPVTPNQNTSQHLLTIYDVEVPTRVPPHGDPLQAELERLCAVKDKFVKFHEDTKAKLKTDCDKEIAEMIAKIKAKYEAKYVEEEATFQLRKKEIDTTVNKVAMNKILAEAFRAKCQDLTSSGTQMPKASQAGLMHQLLRFPVRPSTTPSFPVASSSSPSQPSGRLQTPPPPPSSPPQQPPPPPSQQPPLQIVHQPSALFSNRPSPTTVRSPPTITPNNRPPPVINPVTPITRPPPTVTPNNRPPPVITPVTPVTRPPPNITPVGSLRAPAPQLRPLINSEIRAAAPNLRPPSVSSEIRAMAPHLRTSVHSSEVRAPAPHIPPFTPATSASNEFTPAIRRVPPGHQVTTPVNPQPPSPPLPTTTTQLPPLPPETSYVPPPPPPPTESPPPPPPQSPPPPPPSSETEVINCSSPEYEILDITDIFPEDKDVKVKPSFNKHTSSKHDDVVYLSDDD